MEHDLTAVESVLGVLPVVRSMGTMLFDPFWAERDHVSTSCELFYVIEGNVHLVVPGTSYQAQPGDMLFVPTGTLHRDEFDLDYGLRVFLLQFDWPGEALLHTYVTNDFLCALPTRRKRMLAKMLNTLRGDIRDDSPVDQLLVRSRLLTVLAYLMREAMAEGKTAPPVAQRHANRQRHHALMQAAQTYLEEHYTEAVSLVDIAEALNVSTFHLSHIFSQESDFSLFTYLTMLRMEKACALLREGRLNISEVARTVGYENSNYFSKVFRKHFHCPPSDARWTNGCKLTIEAQGRGDTAKETPGFTR